MVTLRIEHPISDYETWKGAFDRVAEKRTAAGVLRHRIFQPVDDPAYIMLDLDFAEMGQAERFLAFLRSEIWGSSQASPALAGGPQTRIIRSVDVA